MSAQAGWYPDPEGDSTRLRYWDGTQWTTNYMAASDGTVQQQQNPQTPQTSAGQAQSGVNGSAVQPNYSVDSSSNLAYQVFDSEQVYPMTSQDRTLRLIAFIFNIVSCVVCASLIIPLAWMIPMTVMSWNIYKGKRANTTAFGVCTLIFLDLVSGILLLISHRDTPNN